MGKKWDQFLALLGKKKSNEISKNEETDENLKQSVIKMLKREFEDQQTNISQEAQALCKESKKDGVQMSLAEAKLTLTKIINTIGKFSYKSKKLVNLFEDQDIYNEIQENIDTKFNTKEGFSSKIDSDVVQFIINNKTLLKKYKGCLHVAKWPKYLSELPMNKTFNLGCAGSDIRTKLYDEKPVTSTKDAPNPKLVSWLTILGPASPKSKKRVNSIKSIVKKRIDTMLDAINKVKNVDKKIDLKDGIVKQCENYLKNKKSVDVYLCLALLEDETTKIVNSIGAQLVKSEVGNKGRKWNNISPKNINNVQQTPTDFAKDLLGELTNAIK